MDEIEKQAAKVSSMKNYLGNSASDSAEFEREESDEEYVRRATEIVVDAQAASTTMIQKKLKLGYAKASKIMDMLQEDGIISAPDGSKPRNVLISKQDWLESRALAGDNYDE